MKARTMGSIMHGTGLKLKYRTWPSDEKMKGKATRGKK